MNNGIDGIVATGGRPVWLDELSIGSGLHLVTASLCVLAIVVFAWLGRRWRGSPREERLRRRWVYGIFALQAVILTLSFLPPWWDVHGSLPIHLCDIAIWMAAFALLTGRPSVPSIIGAASGGWMATIGGASSRRARSP